MDTGLWQAVRRAADGLGDGPIGAVRRLASVAGRVRLGWVVPPSWDRVAQALRPFADLMATRRRLVFVATGGWAFAARALSEVDGPWADRLTVLDVLDPVAVDRVPDATDLVAVSESGRTLETRLLAGTVAQRYGLRPHRLTGDRLWLHPPAPSVALFGAPLTVAFLLAAATGTAGPGALRDGYRRFAARTERIGEWAAATAAQAPDGPCRLRVDLPSRSPAALRLYALQALRQGLGGKAGTAGLWLDAGPGPDDADARWDAVIELPVDAGDPLVRVMTTCYAVNALVACIGVRRGIPFADHPSVEAYKRLVNCAGPPPQPVPADRIVTRAAAWLRDRPALTRAHLVCYEPTLAGRLSTGADGRWETHPGTTWNHHSFQAVHPEPGIGVAVVAPARTDDPLLRAQASLAAATHAAFGSRSLLLRPAPPGGQPRARR